MSGNLALKSKEVKCYQKWLKMVKKWLKNGVKSEFYCPFLTPILMINAGFPAAVAVDFFGHN